MSSHVLTVEELQDALGAGDGADAAPEAALEEEEGVSEMFKESGG